MNTLLSAIFNCNHIKSSSTYFFKKTF